MCVKFRGSGIDYLSRRWIFDIGAVWITGAGCFLVQNKGGYRDVECNSGALASNRKRSELTGSEAFFYACVRALTAGHRVRTCLFAKFRKDDLLAETVLC